ncbi:MAG: hypothetical protein HKN50_07350 [Gammaproteobacteria bacterium]|nr:hypothetical protein [Gammaproteobacteria bacterium]
MKDDLPEIEFIRDRLSFLSEEEIKEEERRFYELCLLAKEVYKQQQLTDKGDELP